MLRRQFAALLSAAAAGLEVRAEACKPLTIVVGYPAGGSVDASARAVAEGLAQQLHCAVVVDNVPGAAGAIGVQKVVNAPDGRTLLFGSSSELVATRLLNPRQKYDAARDLAPVSYIGELPLVLLASPKLGVRSLQEAIELIRRNPGKVTYGTSGVGSVLHLSGEYMKQMGSLFITHIPYKGATGIATDLASGQIDLAFLGPGAAKPFIDAGRAIPLAVTSRRRIAALPNVPSLSEVNLLKQYDLVGWYAVMAPMRTPQDELTSLRTAIAAVLQDGAVRAKLERVGVEFGSPVADLRRLFTEDENRYRRVVQYSGMKE